MISVNEASIVRFTELLVYVWHTITAFCMLPFFFDCVVSILQIEKMGLRDTMRKVFKMAQCAAEESD